MSGAPSAPSGSLAANGGPSEVGSGEEFPIRLGPINITPAMAASFERLKRRTRLKVGIIARLGLMHYLASQDPHYRED